MKQCALAAIILLSLLLSELTRAGSSDHGVGAVRRPHYTEQGTVACLNCHFGEGIQAVAAGPHGNERNPASPYALHGCESCHGPGSFHVSRAHGGKGFPPLINFGTVPGGSERAVQLQVCLGCHEDRDSDSPKIGFTGSTHDLSSINCANCHQVHTVTRSLATAAQQAEVCFACHAGERNQHPLIGGKPVDFQSMKCSRCHRVHRPPVR